MMVVVMTMNILLSSTIFEAFFVLPGKTIRTGIAVTPHLFLVGTSVSNKISSLLPFQVYFFQRRHPR